MNDPDAFPSIDLAREARFTLGGLEVRPSTRELVAGGVAELLEPRIMQVLIALARRRGQVVSRDDLIMACWGGRAVGEDAINRCIQAIRRIAQTHGGFAVTTVTRVGYRLDESALPFAKAAPAKAEPDPLPAKPSQRERRHLTALACQLVLPGVAARLDPEEWHDLVTEYRSLAGTATNRFGGYLSEGRGERLVIYFGYPDALENAAERAVRTGHAIIETITALGARLGPGSRPRLSVRIGVHAGVVLVARDAAGAVEMFGEAPDIAALAQAQADPDTVVMTGRVSSLVSDLFTLEPCGALALEGAAPLPLARAVVPDPETRHGGQRTAGPFVGREDEAHLLGSRWRRVVDGEGQLVLLSGEPGIGKTRLVEEFSKGLAGGAQAVIACRCGQLFANSPFHALNQMLRQSLGWRGDDPTPQRFGELERTLETAGLKLGEAVPLIAELLNLPVPERYPPQMLPPEQKRKRLLAALVAWVFAVTRTGPLLVIAEDLHWIDPSSLEVLQTLVEQGATAPLMLLCTARPEFRPPWPTRAHHTQLTLNRLGDRDMRALVGGLAAESALAGGVLDAVIQRADGVPLFAEELTRLMQDADGGGTRRGAIPETLLDSLAARLDRLGAAKAVAQLGAILGRDFTYELLHAVSPLPEDQLQTALTRLADAELIYVRGLPPEARYQFKHALIQDAAYGALPREQRRALHGAVARVITARSGAEARPEVLARHWAEAGEDDKAITAWTQAASEAAGRRAFSESAVCYRHALAILRTQAESPTRDLRELDLGLALVPVLQTLTGGRSPEAVEATARTRLLAEKGGFVGATAGMRTMVFSQALLSGDWPKASALADQMADFAGQVGNAEPAGATLAQAMAHFTQFNVRYYRGDLDAAEAGFGLWLPLHEAEGFDQRMSTTIALANGAQIALQRGYADQARQRSARAVAWAVKANSPYELSLALALDALLKALLRTPDEAEAGAARALDLAQPGGFQQVVGWAQCARGWALAQRGAPAEGLAMIRAGQTALEGTEGRVSVPLFLTFQAEAHALNGAPDDAFAALDQALSMNPEERIYRPITLVCRGELLARLGQADQALTSYNAAVAAAHSNGSRTFDLRATVGQARLLRARGATGEARTRLTTVLGEFTEGFDTLDLVEAKALLDDLRA